MARWVERAADAESGTHLDLYWIPLGAGAHVVRASGAAYERLVALLQGRPPQDLYHSALMAVVDGAMTVVEMTPAPDVHGRRDRGVVTEGPVGCRPAGRIRLFRYEIRRWTNGAIPDLEYAVESPVRLTSDPALVSGALAAVSSVPPLTWGRDERRTGDMWNSNSVVAWILTRVGLVDRVGPPPQNGRAPGWHAGVDVASRKPRRTPIPTPVAP